MTLFQTFFFFFFGKLKQLCFCRNPFHAKGVTLFIQVIDTNDIFILFFSIKPFPVIIIIYPKNDCHLLLVWVPFLSSRIPSIIELYFAFIIYKKENFSLLYKTRKRTPTTFVFLRIYFLFPVFSLKVFIFLFSSYFLIYFSSCSRHMKGMENSLVVLNTQTLPLYKLFNIKCAMRLSIYCFKILKGDETVT